MDLTTETLARLMLKQAEANIEWARDRIAAGEDDREFVEMIIAGQEMAARWSQRLMAATFGQIVGASR